MYLSTKRGTRSTDKPIPIYVAFLSWQMSSLVLSNAHKLKDNPLIYGEEQNETQIYIEQMHSPEAKRNVDKEMETEAETP